jgi:hypothetical protein
VIPARRTGEHMQPRLRRRQAHASIRAVDEMADTDGSCAPVIVGLRKWYDKGYESVATQPPQPYDSKAFLPRALTIHHRGDTKALQPSRRIRNRCPIIRSAMRSPPMTATSIRTTQNYGRLPSGLMKTASRSPTNPRFSTAIPTIGPIPRKGHRRLCRHNRRPIRHPGEDNGRNGAW